MGSEKKPGSRKSTTPMTTQSHISNSSSPDRHFFASPVHCATQTQTQTQTRHLKCGNLCFRKLKFHRELLLIACQPVFQLTSLSPIDWRQPSEQEAL